MGTGLEQSTAALLTFPQVDDKMAHECASPGMFRKFHKVQVHSTVQESNLAANYTSTVENVSLGRRRLSCKLGNWGDVSRHPNLATLPGILIMNPYYQ